MSDYAATNVVEDIAESFMTFVLEDEPTGDTVAAQKLDFFWQLPEYVAIRERIRAEFADDLGLVG